MFASSGLGLAQGRLERLLESFTGLGCAGNDINVGTLGLNGLAPKDWHGVLADFNRVPPVIWVLQELHIFKLATADRYSDLDIAVESVDYRASVGTVCILPGRDGGVGIQRRNCGGVCVEDGSGSIGILGITIGRVQIRAQVGRLITLPGFTKLTPQGVTDK